MRTERKDYVITVEGENKKIADALALSISLLFRDIDFICTTDGNKVCVKVADNQLGQIDMWNQMSEEGWGE